MKPFYLHIGAEKCASSLIEHFFYAVDGVRAQFAAQGIAVDSTISTTYRALRPAEHWDEARHGLLRRQYVEPHLDGPATGIFMTEECALGIRHGAGEANVCTESAEFLKRLTEGFDLRLFLVVRRQDTFIESSYNQVVKRGTTEEFAPWFNALPHANYAWDRIADTYADAFGRDKLTVVPYERALYAANPGGPDNLLQAMADWLGFPPMSFDPSQVPVVNPSLPLGLLPAQRRINATIDGEAAARVANILAEMYAKAPGDPLGLFSDDQRQRVLDNFADANRRLFETYMPDFAVDSYLERGGCG